MRAALNQLGIHDCYHMANVVTQPEEVCPAWIRAFKSKYAGEGPPLTKEDWDKMLGQSQATCDLPAAVFSVELAEAYPEAKVIILNRDPEAWYLSVLNSVAKVMKPRGKLEMLSLIYASILDSRSRQIGIFMQTIGSLALGFDHASDKEQAIAWFKDQYATFRVGIPEERRIEYTIKDGWGPLCAHLGVPVPMSHDPKTGDVIEAPFPHVNDREEFQKSIMMARRKERARATENLINIVCRTAVAGAITYAGYMAWHR